MLGFEKNMDALRVSTPCPRSWEDLEGKGLARNCSVCQRTVYNLSECTRGEIRLLLWRHRGQRLCGKLQKRPDGSLKTGKRRTSRLRHLLGLLALFLGLPGFLPTGCNQPGERAATKQIACAAQEKPAFQDETFEDGRDSKSKQVEEPDPSMLEALGTLGYVTNGHLP